MKSNIAFLFIILSLLFQSLASLFTKLGAVRIGTFNAHSVLTNPYYLLSLLCLGLQSLCWPLALRRFPLFWAYLFMSGIYIIIPLMSYFILRESISPFNLAGSLIIMAGIAVMFMNGKKGGRHAR